MTKHPFARAALACASVAAFAGCLDAPVPGEVATADQDIFAQTPGAHQTAKTVSWDAVATKRDGEFALASATASNGFWLYNVNHAVYRDTTGCLRHASMNDLNGVWQNDPSLASCDPGFASAPAAASWAVGRLDVFWFAYSLIGPTHLAHAFWDGTWHYEDLGATATATTGVPAVASWGVGHLDVMWRDSVGDLRWRSFDRSKKGAAGYTPNGWTVGETVLLSYLPNTQITLTEPAVSEFHVFYRTGAGKLMHLGKRPTTAWTLENTNATIDTEPSATSWGAGNLVVYATRTGALRQVTSTAAGWTSKDSTSSTALAGEVVAAAALGRPNRVDFLTSLDGTSLAHTLFQESLPGFAELANPQTQYWCWANAPGMVLNYAYGDLNLATCAFVSAELGTACCVSPTPDDCLTAGDPEDVMDTWGLTWTDSSSVLSAAQLRYELYVRHMPVISHQNSNVSSTNHVVVLRDIYAVAGTDYVVIADPANGGKSWVWPYATYLAYNTNWSVDYMYSGLHLE